MLHHFLLYAQHGIKQHIMPKWSAMGSLNQQVFRAVAANVGDSSGLHNAIQSASRYANFNISAFSGVIVSIYETKQQTSIKRFIFVSLNVRMSKILLEKYSPHYLINLQQISTKV